MRVLVLGGGYAGVVAVGRLERRLPAEVEIILVDPRETHVIRHELHRLIRRPGFAETIQVPYERILTRGSHHQGAITDVDPAAGVVMLAEGEELSYDAAIVSYGAGPAYYGLASVREHGVPLDTPGDARRIAAELEALLEAGEGHVLVGGGGLAGIQAAGEIAQVCRDAAVPDVTVALAEQADRIAPRFAESFSTRIADALASLGVEVRTGREIDDASADEVVFDDGSRLPADQFVWTGGISGRDALSGERPRVRADLRLAGTTFAAGDAVRVVDAHGSGVMASAQTAVGTARVAAENAATAVEAARRGEGGRPRYDRYRDDSFVWVVSVGDRAVAKVGPQVLSGPSAKALKSTVGVGYLSTAGAIREAVALVREEFGFASPLRDLEFGGR